MKKLALMTAAAAVAIAAPSVASAQEATSEAYVGLSAGLHDLGADDVAEDFGIEVDDSAVIFGVVGGVDFPMGSTTFAGVEGNFHLGTGAVDSEYGASARFGFRSEGGAKYYVRGGYQWVDIDVEELLDMDLGGLEDSVDDTGGDYLVGIGADFPVGQGAFRVNVDTISFDTLRGTAGFVFNF